MLHIHGLNIGRAALIKDVRDFRLILREDTHGEDYLRGCPRWEGKGLIEVNELLQNDVDCVTGWKCSATMLIGKDACIQQ